MFNQNFVQAVVVDIYLSADLVVFVRRNDPKTLQSLHQSKSHIMFYHILMGWPFIYILHKMNNINKSYCFDNEPGCHTFALFLKHESDHASRV